MITFTVVTITYNAQQVVEPHAAGCGDDAVNVEEDGLQCASR